MSNQNQNNISWEADEFRHYHKPIGWYIAEICVFLLLMAFFVIIESDIFAAVCLGLIAILVTYFAGQKPQRVNIELNSKGIRFGSQSYPYKQLRFFWVVSNENHNSVNFQTSAFVNNMVILELEDQDPEMVRDFLVQYLPEHEQVHETFVQRMAHLFKF